MAGGAVSELFSRLGIGDKKPVETPGADLKVSGINQFVSSQQQSGNSLGEVFNTANQTGLQSAIQKGRSDVNASFDTAEGAVERRQKGLGISLSDRQRRSQKRRFGLGRSVAEADTANAARRGFADRALEASRGGAGLQSSLLDLEASGRTSLANAAGQEQIRQAERKAAKKEARNSMIGSVVGIAGAFFSSEDYKHDKRPAIETEGSLLERLKKVRVDKWKYVGEDTDHIGPYAEEFNNTFGVGEDNKQMISVSDAVGVLMGSIKELNEKVDSRG